MRKNWAAVEWGDGRLSEVRKSDLVNCKADELKLIGNTVEVLVKESSGNRTYIGMVRTVGSKYEFSTLFPFYIEKLNEVYDGMDGHVSFFKNVTYIR